MPSEFPDKPSSSGLQEADQRSLMRLLMSITAATLLGFALLQYLAGNLWLALGEVLASLLLGWAAWRVLTVRNLLVWIYLYLLPTFSFLVYIIVIPDASSSAFVWVYIIPLLAYLLLGRLRGFVLTAPFLLLATLLFVVSRPMSLSPAGLIDLANALLCGLLIMVFVHVYETRRAAAYQHLERLAQTDALTGVASRGSFQQALENSIREAERSQRGLVLVLLDIDLFKEVNDRHGHDAGDQALRHICAGLREGLRATDRIGRLGGEEFGLLLLHTDRQGAEPLVEALRTRIAASALHYGNQTIALSATFGLAQYPLDGRSAEALYRCADRRLYAGKARGRNRLVSVDAAP